MRRNCKQTLIAPALVAALLAAAPAAALGAPTEVKLRKTSVGTILVNSRGFTLYAFTRDSRNRDVCSSLSGCPKLWPALTTTSRATPGPGVKASLLGTIKLHGSVRQLTYAGHPLYTYIGDSGPGQTAYVNFLAFGGHWPALNAAGHEVTSAPKPPTAAPSPGYSY